MDSISAVARPGEVKGQYHKEGVTKIAPNFANQNWLFMGEKIWTFCSSTVGVGKIAGVWGRNPQSLVIFFFKKKIFFFFQKKITKLR